uniref:Uncharacterized protein n=1 Tax=Oryza sativa subsp. japonica TaxID=39947 RepID=Q2QRW5_ORYSJ|nr:hypothetical protein LOC_Os12g26170 [Oryza sativa Japonica Group]
MPLGPRVSSPIYLSSLSIPSFPRLMRSVGWLWRHGGEVRHGGVCRGPHPGVVEDVAEKHSDERTRGTGGRPWVCCPIRNRPWRWSFGELLGRADGEIDPDFASASTSNSSPALLPPPPPRLRPHDVASSAAPGHLENPSTDTLASTPEVHPTQRNLASLHTPPHPPAPVTATRAAAGRALYPTPRHPLRPLPRHSYPTTRHPAASQEEEEARKPAVSAVTITALASSSAATTTRRHASDVGRRG